MDQQFKQPRLQSSQSHFSHIPGAEIPRSSFNRTNQLKTTFNSGLLIPIFADEVLPGDSHKIRTTTFARLATPITPFMDNIYADIHYWFVPNRLLWENWERFNGAQDNPDDSTDFLMPILSPFTPASQSISDYLGLVPGKVNTGIRSDWHRAYNLIWNEWYRDENLQDSVYTTKGDGPDAIANFTLLRRGRRKDYFTGALPFPQKGPSVTIPLGGFAPVTGTGSNVNINAGGSNHVLYRATATNNIFAAGAGVGTDQPIRFGLFADGSGTGLQTDLNDATGVTINALREAIQIQRLFERDARGGTRYVELLKSHFGVTSPDFRLQRPEYLGGGTTIINQSPIPQTSESADTPQGNLAAMATFSHHGVGFSKSFVEHGIILGLISVRADQTYQQGINRMFYRSTRFDFYWPAFSHLGEQAIYNKEIWLGTDATINNQVFGYQERYAEYRYKPSMITGLMRSDAAGTLDYWHLAVDYATLPALNSAFIQENPPIERVVAVTDQPQFICDVVFSQTSARPMPVYSVPGLMDHF